MIRRSLPIVLALALALVLSACGFHLRDALVLPNDLGPVRVASTDRYSPLPDSLTRSIQRAGAQIAGPDDATATVIDLLSERWGNTPISVDQFGRAQEYSLRYAVVFEVRRADGTKAVPRQAVELSRDYVSSPTDSIGEESERDLLEKELRREMAASIIRRLNAVARTGGAAPTPESRLDEPVAEDAAKAALEAADANPPPDEPAPDEPAPANPPQPR
ncbi:LPS assembly lipoprotein LptE [Lysobacter sp. Root494]|uniref:LPS-assembly lipoprotein LptE n=1 Tax=Lysobacter sp. Root494 TaxID=1736549 RepID=UPI0009EB32DF|nr:LPS assembly lipoprotein LptE [Lysobacter sp. Root494]